MMRALMVQGTSSWAGKSLIATAFCRYLARRGVRVAPFKAQNMSNNARVVAGGEIGVAQYLQARAAGIEPDVRMNPVLVKPEGMTQSQVVVRGRVDPEASARPWRQRAPLLWPAVEASLRSLMDEFEMIVLEGAGSPAEINLLDCDLTNHRSAEAADARVLLVADIDRGGSFAHLYGTWSLTEHRARERLCGFVLNKFRGDPALLEPAPERLAALTGVPVVGVIPWLAHQLPDEDGAATPLACEDGPTVAIVRYPMASNLDEFKSLEQVARVRWATTAAELDGAQLVVLPGSKHVAADLLWLRSTGLDRAIAVRIRDRGRVLGVCGGLQMLGRRLYDPYRIDGAGEGLGVLDVDTTFEHEKIVRRTTFRFAEGLDGAWHPLAGIELDGYEIRQGRTVASGAVREAIPGGLGWCDGSALGLTVHGLLEEPEVLARLFGRRPSRSLDDVLDELTDAVIAGLDARFVERLVGLA
jgi:adenosylcobyric acid synthase